MPNEITVTRCAASNCHIGPQSLASDDYGFLMAVMCVGAESGVLGTHY